jgi:S-adenosylmethionine decarboxylase proenzyme
LSFCHYNIYAAEDLKILCQYVVSLAGMHQIADCAVTVIDGDNFGSSCLICIVPLQESHLSVHTWPELRYVSADLYTCGDYQRGYMAFKYLVSCFQAEKVNIQEIERVAHV